MFMDYMDYVDDDAMFMFSVGQIARMHATLEGPRASLVAPTGSIGADSDTDSPAPAAAGSSAARRPGGRGRGRARSGRGRTTATHARRATRNG
jgi:hypothetical protein